MSRTVKVLATAAGVAALAAQLVASAFAAIERELGTYRVEVPNTVPGWMNEEADL